MGDICEAQRVTRVETNRALYKDFLEGNLSPELKTYFSELNIHLSEMFGSRFVELIPLGSIRGNWAVRKLFGSEKTPYSDVDMGVIIQETSFDGDSFVGLGTVLKIYREIKAFSKTHYPKIKLCGEVNPPLVYVNIDNIGLGIISTLGAVRQISETGRTQSLLTDINLLKTALPFLSSKPEITGKMEEEILKRYTIQELEEIRRGVLLFTSVVAPKHLHEVGARNVDDPRSRYISQRMTKLRWQWREKQNAKA